MISKSVLRNGGFHIPVPLRIEVGVGDEEERLLVLCPAKGGTGKHRCYRNTADIHFTPSLLKFHT